MSPRFYKLALWLFTMLPSVGFGYNLSPTDSLKILKQDSIAYKLFLSKPDSSISISTETLHIAVEHNNTFLEGVSYYVLSKAYWAKANYKLSTEFGFKSLKIFEKTNQISLWGKSLLALARTLIELQNYEQSYVYLESAILLAKRHNDAQLLAEAYREKSMLLTEKKQYDSALFYADEGISLFEKFKDSTGLSILYSRKGKIYFNLKDYENSTAYNRKALLYDILIGNRRALGVSYYQSALDAFHLNKIDSAIIFLNKSVLINQEIRNLSSLIKSHNLLADIYLKKHKPELSIEHLKQASQYKDSLYNTEKSGQIQEMQSLYELSSKEQTIAILEKENAFEHQQSKLQKLLVTFLLVCIFLMGLMILFLQRYRRLQDNSNRELAAKNQAIEQQKEEILSQAETLQQLNHLKSKLFSVISHDLRGPMASLHALLDLLIRKKLTQEEFIAISNNLKTNLDATQSTLENLLNWSLSQMEGIRTEPKTINIKHLINDICILMAETARQKNVHIKNEIEDEIFVRVDPNQLQLILRNLIHNAIKFSKPYDTIISSVSRNKDYCAISIKDSGIGMTTSEMESVVNSKQHFSKTGTMQEKGTGLGLLLCIEFIKLNGGEINIQSNINQGTEVIFTLPLA